MTPHPDFADIALPRDFALGAVRFTPLSPEHVDEDLAAVQATAPLLEGIFGTWPSRLTREDNLIDLAWHEREFTARRSFSWILRDAGGAYIGCFYLFPAIGQRGAAEAALWLCDIPDRVVVAAQLKAALTDWMARVVPQHIAITWNTRPDLAELGL
ncbi:MAG: hypothetical protein AAF748_06135 [Pseudomonadota bacterium]